MSVPARLTPEQADAAASLVAEARVSGLDDDAVAAVLGWPRWLVRLLADVVIAAERED